MLLLDEYGVLVIACWVFLFFMILKHETRSG